jgi:hypothetical protein
MIVRKSATLRWSEEAEAHHVREWAKLERAAQNNAARAELCAPRPHSSRRWPAFSRLLSLFGRQTSEIA